MGSGVGGNWIRSCAHCIQFCGPVNQEGSFMQRIASISFFFLTLVSLNSCHLAAAAGAGAVAADEFEEAQECGDEFDPVDDVTGEEEC